MVEQGVIALKGVSKSFDGAPVLENIDLVVEEGERLSLLGPGGCGKTTILKLLLGLIDADSGEIFLNGIDMRKATGDEKLKNLRSVGVAFQQGALFDSMSVRDNLFFAMEHMTDLSQEEMVDRCQGLLDGVKLGRTINMLPHELSGGMQRRVGIARALATDPTIAIFDEPTAGLDPVTSTIILNMIRDLLRPEATSMIATSNIEIGLRFSDRVVVLNEKGRVAADGFWRDLLLDGPEWVKHFLSVRLIGLDIDYVRGMDLPQAFIDKHW